MSEPNTEHAIDAVRLDYLDGTLDRAEKWRRRLRIAAIIFCALSATAFVGSIVWTGAFRSRGQHEIPDRLLCERNLKNCAAALIEYSNKHDGNYPDQLTDLLATGLPPEMLVCHGSHDVPVTRTAVEQSANLLSGGHCSYIYLGKGLNSTTSPSEAVLMYEPLSNHFNRGMNALFVDYHVDFLPAASAQAMLKSIVPGQPLIWPPRTGVTTMPAVGQ